MPLRIPLPYGEMILSVRKTRYARPLFWSLIVSALLHVLVLSALVAILLPIVLPRVEPQPIMVSVSTSLRIEHRTHPRVARVVPQRRSQMPTPQEPTPQHAMPQQPTPQEATPQRTSPRQLPPARELPPVEKAPRPQAQRVAPLSEQLARDTRAFAQTAAKLNAANNPLVGAANPSKAQGAPKRYTMDLDGVDADRQPEGTLYPVKRWTDGLYVYYYVRYVVYYADGTSESGSVPWPIHFLLSADPFAVDHHRMPLPGPPAGYVMPDDVAVTPLVRNCYVNHDRYCPIERNATAAASSRY